MRSPALSFDGCTTFHKTQRHDAPSKLKSIAICDEATVDKWLASGSKWDEVELPMCVMSRRLAMNVQCLLFTHKQTCDRDRVTPKRGCEPLA
jgi:hypothetical protein